MSDQAVSVLLVEDDPDDAWLIAEYLREFGRGAMELDRACSLQEALARTPGAFDAVLLDINLPDSQGVASVSAVQRHFGDVAIAVLTGHNEASLAAESVRLGAQDYIVKGELTGPELVSAVRRVIDLKRSAELERLRDRERLQNEFIANVSHEFRTPIAALKAAVETLQAPRLLAAQRREFLGIIARHVERLGRLVEDVLLVSSLDAAQRLPPVKPVWLKQAVDSCLSRLAAVAGRAGILLSMDVAADLRVLADEAQLQRVLESLCANGIDYNCQGGRLRVEAAVKGSEAVVTVSDTGMGIPVEELPRLFDRFHRSNAARGRKLGGSGLGLMIVKRLVEAQGGRVWVESREGSGSIFRFTLPLYRGDSH